MNQKVIVAYLIIVLSVSSILTGFSNTKEKITEEISVTNFLRINNYYVMFAAPGIPFVDQNNRFMVPLRAISEILDVSITNNKTNNTTILASKGQEVVLKVGDKNAYINGDKYQMGTEPVMVNDSLFIPIRLLADAFGFKIDASVKNVIHLQDDNFLKKGSLKYLSELDPYSISEEVNQNAILPIKMKATKYVSSENTHWDLKIIAENRTGRDIAEGKEDFSMIRISDKETVLEYMTGYDRSRKRNAIKKDSTITVNFQYAVKQTQDSQSKYVFITGRELK